MEGWTDEQMCAFKRYAEKQVKALVGRDVAVWLMPDSEFLEEVNFKDLNGNYHRERLGNLVFNEEIYIRMWPASALPVPVYKSYMKTLIHEAVHAKTAESDPEEKHGYLFQANHRELNRKAKELGIYPIKEIPIEVRGLFQKGGSHGANI